MLFTFYYTILSIQVVKSNSIATNQKSFAKTNRFPFLAGVTTKQAMFERFICNGAIISEHHILSAAGDIDIYVDNVSEIVVLIGLASDDEIVISFIDEIILHPNYDRFYLLNDLAILTTKRRMVFDEFLQAISLPIIDLTNRTGMNAVVSGWGLTKVSSYRINIWCCSIVNFFFFPLAIGIR